MAIEGLLNLIRTHFSPTEAKVLLKSLQQDQLVWEFISDEEKSRQYFDSMPKSLAAFSPGEMAVWSIEQNIGVPLSDINQQSTSLPNEIKRLAARTYESTFNTGLPPTNLSTAGLLALTLRERRILKGTWDGISDEIFIKRKNISPQRNIAIWQSPFACLFTICQDLDELVLDFLYSNSSGVLEIFVPILVHAYLANPMEESLLIETLHGLIGGLPIDYQLEALKWIRHYRRTNLQKELAQILIKARTNTDFFSSTFSRIASFDSRISSQDPLEIDLDYQLPEDINRLAAFFAYSGDNENARQKYDKAAQIAGILRIHALFQSIVDDQGNLEEKKIEATWRSIIEALPDSEQARLFYAKFLIEKEKYPQAEVLLEGLPESQVKSFLSYQIRKTRDPEIEPPINHLNPYQSDPAPGLPPGPSYFVNYPHVDITSHLLDDILETNNINTKLVLLEKTLESQRRDPEIVTVARDLYIKSQNYQKAIELSTYLHLLNPEDLENERTLARLYMLAGRWNDAYQNLQHLMKSIPSPSTECLEWFAESALKTGRDEMAISICQNILKQEPHATRALILLGEGFMRKGDVAKAIQHIEKVVEMIPEEAETWIALARLWRENGQTDRALEILQKGVLAVPDSAQLHLALGRGLLEKKAPSDAITHLKKAYDLAPEKIETKLALAQAEYYLGQYSKAWKILEPFTENYENDPYVARLLGHVLLAMDKAAQAKDILLLAAEHFPEDLKTVLAAADLILDQSEEALQKGSRTELDRLQSILEKSQRINPDNIRVQLHLADIDGLMENHQKALEIYLSLSEKDLPKDPNLNWRLQYGLGCAALATNNEEIGLAALQQATSLQPENLNIQHALAEAYQKVDLPKKAKETTKTALRLAPQDLDNILWYAQFHLRLNEPKEAVNALQEALQIDSERSELRLWLAQTQISIGDLAGAKQNLLKIISEGNTSKNDLHQTGYLCLQLNDVELAVEALEKAQRRSGEPDPTLLMDLAVGYTLMDQSIKALEILNQNASLIEHHPELMLLKSDLLSKLGQYEPALTALKSLDENQLESIFKKEKSTGLERTSPLLYTYDFSLKGYHLRVGQLLRILGDINGAKEALLQATSYEPKDIRTQNACIEVLALAFDFKRALRVAEESPNILPNQSHFNHDFIDLVCTQAEIHFAMGNYEKASSSYERISHIMPTYPRSLALQSRLAMHFGETSVARDYLEESIDSYHITVETQETTDLQDIFRQNLTLLGIADAAMELHSYQTAIDYHQKAFERLSNQPLQNFRYGLALLKSAEAQRIAEILSITTHAPGEEMLSQQHYVQFQKQCDLVSPYISDDRLRRMKARGTAAFHGQWESYLNLDDLIKTPADAASFILSSDRQPLVKSIASSYSREPLVLQAYGIFALKNNQSDGIQAVEDALAMDMVNPINYALLAFLNMDAPEIALRSLETALNFWPNEPEWHAIAAELTMKLGQSSSASRHIDMALDTHPEKAAYWEKSAGIKLEKQDITGAIADLEKSAVIQPDRQDIWMRLARVYRQTRKLTEAIAANRKALGLSPDNIQALQLQAELFLDSRQYSTAAEVLKKILKLEPENDYAVRLLAQTQAKAGKFEKALNTLDEALSKVPESKSFHLEKILIRSQQEGPEATLPDLIHLAKENPTDPEVLTLLTDFLIQTNRLDKAERTAQTILKIIPDQPEVHLMLGRLQRLKGQLDQAIDHLSRAITINPQLVDAYIELGKTYQDRRDHQRAIKIYQQASQANPGDPKPYYFAALALKEIKDYKSAEAMLKQAKKVDPEDPSINRQLGVITALNLVNNLRETK